MAPLVLAFVHRNIEKKQNEQQQFSVEATLKQTPFVALSRFSQVHRTPETFLLFQLSFTKGKFPFRAPICLKRSA